MTTRRIMGIETEYGVSVPGQPSANHMVSSSLVVNAYFATGSSDWYRRGEWHEALVKGWSRACADAGATWGGGESPSLPGLVNGEDIELAGSAVGALPPGRAPILGEQLLAGDEIVLVASSGLHANGASLARMVAGRLPEGYDTPLPSGRSFGDALLDPSILYARLVGGLADADVQVSYLSHVTGHGLLKLMRPSRDLTYRISTLPPVPEVLDFLVEQSQMFPHRDLPLVLRARVGGELGEQLRHAHLVVR